jgi:hypothetical protein
LRSSAALTSAISLFLEERHRIIAQIDDLEFGVVALLGDVRQPLRRLFGKTGGAGGAENDSDLGLQLPCP